MQCDVILGTAGHIDHGKTALVKALTGIDCDRLPEEKARGITIDLGFAHLDLSGIRLGIVDVPGHERFIRNMLAGAAGIDCALLVVAADDSVMPQTREHLEILKLLTLAHGVIALTKCDLVDDTTRGVVALEVRELVKGSFLEAAPLVFTSAHTGSGIEELKTALAATATLSRGPTGSANTLFPFRLAVDRVFVSQGHGTIVTGSVVSGSIKTGGELDWHQGNGSCSRVRIRGLSNHGREVEEVHRGQRAALNLAGVPHEAVRRGQELCSPGYLHPSKILTVRLHSSAAFRRPIKHRLPVRLHIGTAEVMATVSLLDCDRIEPGRQGLAQLFLEKPVTSVWGQRFVVRDSSAEHTLGGGLVLQPVAGKIRRRLTESLERLNQLGSNDPGERVLAAAWFAGFAGILPADRVRETGLPISELATRIEQLRVTGTLVQTANSRPAIHADRLAELERRLLEALAVLHAENPLASTHDRRKVMARFEHLDDHLTGGVIDRLIEQKKLIGDSHRVARTDFKPKLSANQRKLKDQIVAAHAAAGCQPPEPKAFANQAGGNAASLKEIFEVAVAEGDLVKVADDLFLDCDVEAEMRRRVRERLQAGQGVTVAQVRDLLGTTRKYAVPLCEYLDRIGLTRRDGDLRFLVQ
jgi:selenocysteine-specific elongation factor